MRLNIFFKRVSKPSVLPIQRMYELVYIHDGSQIVSGLSHNVCTFAMWCYRHAHILFDDSDIPRTKSEIDSIAALGPKASVALRVVGIDENIEVKHRNGKIYLKSWDDAKGWS